MNNADVVKQTESGVPEASFGPTPMGLLEMDEPPECAYDATAEHDYREVDHGLDGNNPYKFHSCGECNGCGEMKCERGG